MKKALIIDVSCIIAGNAVPGAQPEFYKNAIGSITKLVNGLDLTPVLLFDTTCHKSNLDCVLNVFKSEEIVFELLAAEDDLNDVWNDAASMAVISGNGLLHNFTGRVIQFEASENNWKVIDELLTGQARKVKHERKTKETQITVELNLDGQGKAEIKTGLHFFNHMLEQIARHGNMDLHIEAKGDLHIDEHHTIEDTAITLGEAFAKALGDKKGIERYGFCLPMDDALAQVAIDFGGRNWLVWQADFKREKVGDVPSEMFMHFFKSFSDGAKCNLNIEVTGENEHHKIEAVFKAFAKAIKMAVKRDFNNMYLPSTKGVL